MHGKTAVKSQMKWVSRAERINDPTSDGMCSPGEGKWEERVTALEMARLH